MCAKSEFDLKDQNYLVFKKYQILTNKVHSIFCRDRFIGLPVDIRNKPVSSLPTQRDAVKQFRGESVKILCRDAISMADIAENQPDSTSGFDPRIQSEDIAFKPDEMLACDACTRKNPPNRLKCMYCGNDLEIKPENAALVKPALRKLECWERGFNVIIREPVGANQLNLAHSAAFLSMEPDDLAVILDAGEPLPLIRIESQNEAEILIAGLAKLGLKCSILADATVADDKMPVRLSNIELSEGSIAVTDFNTQKVTVVDDLALLIPGIITTSKVDSLEKKRRGKSTVIDETATASDESILDIYSRDDPFGFRVHLTGFDFSCLGDDKGLLAVENVRRLVVTLKEHVPSAKLVADYKKVRPALRQVWEIEARKDPKGLHRSGFAKRGFGTVASTSNLRQFTKYSRLQWHLL